MRKNWSTFRFPSSPRSSRGPEGHPDRMSMLSRDIAPEFGTGKALIHLSVGLYLSRQLGGAKPCVPVACD
jgi:hypothetical protein